LALAICRPPRCCTASTSPQVLLQAPWSACRYGFIGEELVAQLVNAQEVFYEGLADLAAGADGAETERVKELEINGVKVTVTDKLGIDGGLGAAPGGPGVIEDTGIRLQFVESVELGGGAGGEGGRGLAKADAMADAVDVEFVEVGGDGDGELGAEELIAELMAGGEQEGGEDVGGEEGQQEGEEEQ
jgi:hypothetical protein